MSTPAQTDLMATLQNLVTSVISALASLFTAFAEWVQQNAALVATIIGFVMLGLAVSGVITDFGRRVYGFFRGIFRRI